MNTDPHLGRSLVTDSKRLQQVLKNLLSNAFKFTEQGGVRLSVFGATMDGARIIRFSVSAASVVAFEVADTGIGIPLDKQRIIFEAFQQADAGTSRKYGGTGSGPGHQPRIGQLAGRRNPATQYSRARAARSRYTCRRPMLAHRRRKRDCEQAMYAPGTAVATVADRGHLNIRSNRFRTIATICSLAMPCC